MRGGSASPLCGMLDQSKSVWVRTHLSAQTPLVRHARWTPGLVRPVMIERLGHDDDALAWDVVLFQELSKDDLGFAGRVAGPDER